jgi:hypothetical protein
VAGATFTPTPTRTPTNTTVPSITPTPTRGNVCEDGFEPDDSRGAARVINVQAPQERTMCPVGDEDWIYFGGVEGKVYTIDVTTMDPGIDLSLELFNDRGERIAFNDDFYDRDPANPNPFDTKPRIQSFRIPYDGSYYIRVRDVAGRGGTNFFYTIVLLDESFGPTPTLVAEICLDKFEPNGLPEEARLITSNERQEDHRLCPAGDADWSTFFGLAGKRYVMFTDTRRYTRNDVNQDTVAGADTVMVLTDRDGVTILDVNDDIPGASTLDSQIEFIPSVDGFYFVQIKNVGDIGNQFIRYDFTLLLCLPGQTDCGRGAAQGGQPEDPGTPGPTGTPAEFVLPTVAVIPSITPTTGAAANDPSSPDVTGATPDGFADDAFKQIWQRNDLSLAAQRIERSWLWGPSAFASRNEAYRQGQNGLRLVQYFDKARMEINDASQPRSSVGYVTNGLLVRELVTGAMQVGDNQFLAQDPAEVVIAGDADDSNAPTYASFATVIGERAADLTGERADRTLRRGGQVVPYEGRLDDAASFVRYVEETGHNIPRVFWEYLNSEGEIFDGEFFAYGQLFDWVNVMGYPISEPYWMRVQVNGRPTFVLAQAFERRVLTYNPTNAAAWQVEMGNVGRHYYAWRYETVATRQSEEPEVRSQESEDRNQEPGGKRLTKRDNRQ